MTPLLRRIAEWATQLRLEDIPERVQERLRLQIGSAISAAAGSPWHGPARAVLRAHTTPGSRLVYATGDRLPPADAAFVNAAFAMSLDMDDYLLSGHTAYSAVLVPLAFAETLDDVVVAAAAANEVMGRLSTACLIGPVNGQMSSYIHNIGAALALGVVWGLDVEVLTNAMALALYQPNLCLAPGFWDDGAKVITASQPLAQGIRAVELAKAGLRGPADLIEHPLGFVTVFAFDRFLGLFDAIGSVWFSDTLCYKRFPGTSYISAGVEGALDISGGRQLRPSQIKSVIVETTVLSSTLDSIGAAAIDRTPMDANAINFSLRLSVATALRCGDLTADHLRPENLAPVEEDIRAITRRIEVVHDWSQTLSMLGDDPVGLSLLARLSPTAWVRTIAHARRLSRSSGQVGRNRATYRGVLRALPGLLTRLGRARLQPVSDDRFDPTRFSMRQSARVRIEGATPGETFVAVPLGACGRDLEETKDVVRWRLEQAFGSRAEAVWLTTQRAGTTVVSLEESAIAR